MALITCPTDCAAGGVPDVAFDLCNPTRRFGEIQQILVAQVGQPMTTGDAAEITTRLGALAGAAEKMVVLKGYGDMPAATGEPNRISSLYTVTPPKQRTVNFTILDLNDTNYEFLRKLDKCGGRYLFWFVTADGDMFGGEDFVEGVEADATANYIIPASDQESATGTLTINWTGAMPERKPSVIS
jgi:hypothetical protein